MRVHEWVQVGVAVSRSPAQARHEGQQGQEAQAWDAGAAARAEVRQPAKEHELAQDPAVNYLDKV